MADSLLYSRDHAWVRVEGNRAVVGISEFARSELGEVSYVELPAPGKRVARGEVVCAIDSLKSASDIYAPLTGTVAAGQRAAWPGTPAARWSTATRWAKAGCLPWSWRIPRSSRELLDAGGYRRYLEGG